MRDADKTRAQLIAELVALRQQNAALRAAVDEHKQIQEALRASEEQFVCFMDNLPGVAFIKDLHGRHVFVNQRLADFLKLTHADWHGKTNEDLFPPDIARRFTENDRLVLSRSSTLEVEELTRDGSTRYYWLVNKFPIRNQDGTPILLGGMGIDITERKQAEEALQASETHLRTLLETVGAAVFIFQGTQMCYANAAAEALSGYTRDELLAMTFWQVIHPAYQDLVRQRGLARQRGKQIPSRYELKIVTKSGLERWVDFTAGTITFAGKSAVLGTVFDISERKQAEETLREQERQLRLVTDNLPAIMCYVDKNLLYRFVNETFERWHGISAADVIGKPVSNVIGDGAYRVLQRHIQDALVGREIVFEALVPYQYAGTRHVSAKYVPHSNDQGDILGFFALIDDITERQRREERLRRSQKMEAVGTLAGGVAHEFNNILGIILGFTDLTQHDVPHGSVIWQNLQEVLTAGKRAKNLVQQMMAFSSHSSVDQFPVQFNLMVKESLLLLQASLPSTIAIQRHVDTDVGTVLANRTQIHQLLVNLCANAEYAMRDTGGVLEIRLDPVEVDDAFAASHPGVQPGPHVRLTVRDTGCGMEAEVIEHIFEPFFTTKKVGEGTGMGLAVVHSLVANHGGAVTVQSTPEAGTTFCIFLPQTIAPHS